MQEQAPVSAPQSLSDLAPLISRIGSARLLVLGDIMLDRYVYGAVERISPESPVPVLSIAREESMLGGAGNVLSNLAGLGAGCNLLAVLGNDDEARQVRAMVRDAGFPDDGLIVDDSRPTTVKTRFLASHQQLLRTDSEKPAAISDALMAALLERAKAHIAGAGAVILSDYGKGLLRQDLIAEIVRMARTHGIPVLVDPKGQDYSRYAGASIVTPNRKELSEATGGRETRTDQDIVDAARHLIGYSGISSVVATRSRDGISVIESDGAGDFAAPVHLATEALEVFDVSGAGDTVIATIGAALAAGASLKDAARLANVAGGIVVQKVGTAPIRAIELQDAATGVNGESRKADAARARAAKICAGWDEAAEDVKRWRAKGLKVGFTNGCFDILHAGHVTYLNKAREMCDRLVIAVNADESVRRLKGPSRPVNDQMARARVLGALGSIDLVIVFGSQPEENDTPNLLISRLKPDIHFKGGDYRPDQLPEGRIVESYGGRVVIIPFEDGFNTTQTIGRLKAAG